MKTFLVIIGLIGLTANIEAAKKSGSTIREATSYCESEVPKHCISITCPLYCSTFNSAKSKESCAKECNKDKRCKLKTVVGSDDPKNMVLDALNRDQLWACIAEKRDPSGGTTGRRTTPWKQLETPEFTKATSGRS